MRRPPRRHERRREVRRGAFGIVRSSRAASAARRGAAGTSQGDLAKFQQANRCLGRLSSSQGRIVDAPVEKTANVAKKTSFFNHPGSLGVPGNPLALKDLELPIHPGHGGPGNDLNTPPGWLAYGKQSTDPCGP